MNIYHEGNSAEEKCENYANGSNPSAEMPKKRRHYIMYNPPIPVGKSAADKKAQRQKQRILMRKLVVILR